MSKADQTAADRVLKAGVKRAIAMTREGRPSGVVAVMLAACTAAADVLLDEAVAS